MNDAMPPALATYARAHAAMPGVVTELTPELRAALAEFVAATPAPPSDRDAAALAVELLESDPTTAARLRNLPISRTFVDAPTIALSAAILIALQTHVRFERTPDGKWSILIEKKPTSDALITQLFTWLSAAGKQLPGTLPRSSGEGCLATYRRIWGNWAVTTFPPPARVSTPTPPSPRLEGGLRKGVDYSIV